MAKIKVLVKYPSFNDIEKLSPPVSPKVVAKILVIQNRRVTWGTLVIYSLIS
jgi:hypothetical protein